MAFPHVVLIAQPLSLLLLSLPQCDAAVAGKRRNEVPKTIGHSRFVLNKLRQAALMFERLM